MINFDLSSYVKISGNLTVFSDMCVGPVFMFADESKEGIYELTQISENDYLKVFRKDSQLNLFSEGNVLWEGKIDKNLERKCHNHSIRNKDLDNSWDNMFRRELKAELYKKI